MAIIDHANFMMNGRKIFAYEYPEHNLSSLTQLNVRAGQEALFLLGGQIEQVFQPNGARPYTLDTANLPVVRKLFGIPFGGSNPLLASVWFINKADLVNMEIKTDTFLLKDPMKPQGFPAIAVANLGMRVVDSQTFFLHLVNGNSCFGEDDMIKSIQGRVTRVISERMAQMVDQLGLTVADLNARLSLLSQQSQDACMQLLEGWGLEFADFNVRVTQDTSREGLMMASGYGTDPASFERQRMLDIQEKAINNMSSGQGGGLLGAVLAMGMMNQMNNQPRYGAPPPPPQGGMQGGGMQQPQQQAQQTRMVYCGNCGRKYDPASTRFCPNCGKEYLPCPRCGSDNVAGSRRCVNCGSALQAEPAAGGGFCPRCGAKVPAASNFCPQCGEKVK